MIKLHKSRDLRPCTPSQGLKLHPVLAEKRCLPVDSFKSTPIRRKTSLVLSYGLFLLLAALVAACWRDPDVRKLQFLQPGDVCFETGKYREANVSYSRGLRIDPRFGEAHSKRPRCLL